MRWREKAGVWLATRDLRGIVLLPAFVLMLGGLCGSRLLGRWAKEGRFPGSEFVREGSPILLIASVLAGLALGGWIGSRLNRLVAGLVYGDFRRLYVSFRERLLDAGPPAHTRRPPSGGSA